MELDSFTAKGAERLRHVLLEYWASRGYLNVRIERYQVQEGVWGVRSNLLNGLPPRRVKLAA